MTDETVERMAQGDVAIPVVFHDGGGVCFVVEPDKVRLLRLTPDLRPDSIVPELGAMNREHAAQIAKELLAALSALTPEDHAAALRAAGWVVTAPVKYSENVPTYQYDTPEMGGDRGISGTDPIPDPEVGQVWRGSGKWPRIVTRRRGQDIWHKRYPDSGGEVLCLLSTFVRWARRTGARPDPQRCRHGHVRVTCSECGEGV